MPPALTPDARNTSGHTQPSLHIASESFNVAASGTDAVNCGSIPLKAATYNFKAILGCVNPAHTATLKIYRFSDSALIGTIGGVAGALAEHLGSNIVIPADDWYEITIESDNDQGVALLRSLSWD